MFLLFRQNAVNDTVCIIYALLYDHVFAYYMNYDKTCVSVKDMSFISKWREAGILSALYTSLR